MMSESKEKILDLRSVFGLQATITTPASATGGEYVEMDVTAEPGSETLIHYHPKQEETYRALEGAL
jgi:quercetin dioxygenase-like cupin family protein